MSAVVLDPLLCQKARLSRDARFDGRFFVAVTSTGIFCRNICPAPAPKEQNVQYFSSAVAALTAGFRPCLRCRPDSAPGSAAWVGRYTTLQRAQSLIQQGALQETNLAALASRLGVSERYLRKLFVQELGISPKRYALMQQVLFAKQLLQGSLLSITEIALASGFNSIRSFNAQCQAILKLTPGELRKNNKASSSLLRLHLYYRPPFAWPQLRDFLQKRALPEIEWSDEQSYGRTFRYQQAVGAFTLVHEADKHRFRLSLTLEHLQYLRPILQNIRRLLDLDVDIAQVEHDLAPQLALLPGAPAGLRLPGLWNTYEAGVRAILGQQVSVKAAQQLMQQLVAQLGESYGEQRLFPQPKAVAESELLFLKMPQARRDTLRRFSLHMLNTAQPDDVDAWQTLKGIGPWTCQYAKMRGLSDPDIWLGGDAGVKNALKQRGQHFAADAGRPWRSYLTLHLWHSLNNPKAE